MKCQVISITGKIQINNHNWKIAAEERCLIGDNAPQRMLCAAVIFGV